MSIKKRNFLDSVSLRDLVICISLLFILLVMRDIYKVEINKFIFIIPFALAFYLLDFSEIVCFLSFVIPLASGLPKNYIFIVLLFALIYKKHSSFRVIQIAIPFLILIAELLHLQEFTSISVINIYEYITTITIIAVIVFERNEVIEYRNVLMFFGFGVCALILIVVSSSLQYMSLQEALLNGYRFGNVKNLIDQEAILMVSNNANNIAYYCIMATSSILVVINNKRTSKLLGIFFMSIFVLGGLLTASRSFVIVLVLLICIYLFIQFKPRVENIIILIVSLLLIWGFYIIISNVFPELIKSILYRFQEVNITGDRGIIFDHYNNFMLLNPINTIFGIGLLSMATVTGIELAPHNGIQQIWVAYGFLGLAFFLYVLNKIILNAKQGRKVKVLFYLPLITIILFTQTIQFLAPFELMLPMIIGFSSIRLGSTIGGER